MLQVRHLSMVHQTDLKEMMNDLSFTVNPGDKVALIGEEGNGKSTLLKWIIGDKAIQNYVQVEGELVNQFSKTIYLPQSLPTEYHAITLEEYFFGPKEAMKLDYQMLYQLGGQWGFDADRFSSSQTLGSLSGGEKVKIQIIKALALNPDLLLLDEPSNDLDLETVQWLERFIQSTSITMIYISHDESLLAATATKIVQLELLKHKTIPVATVANLSYQDYIEQKQSRFEHQTQVASKQREEHEKQMDRYRRIESSVHDAQNAISRQSPGEARLLKKKMHAVKSMGRRFEREEENFEAIPMKEDAILIKFSNTKPLPAGKTLLHLENQTVERDGNKLAVGLNLHIKGPKKIGIIGQNGIGKSTWLKELWTNMKERTDILPGYMPQNYFDYLKPDETPIQFLQETGDRDEQTQVMTYLGSMRFTPEEMQHPIRALSGGQQAKLLLLKIDLLGQNVLLLDEPTRNFSPMSQGELRNIFKNFPGAIIAVSHDRLFLKEVCDEVYKLTKTGFMLTELT